MSKLRQKKLPRKIPLFFLLVLIFVTLTVFAVGLAGYLSFHNGQHAVNDVAQNLHREIMTRIEDHVQAFLNTPYQINEINAYQIEHEILDYNDAHALAHHFWHQIKIFNLVSSIYFGNTKGGLVDACREEQTNDLSIICTDDFVRGTFRKYATDNQGKQTQLLLTVPDFDARTRPWYKDAVSKTGLSWSKVYILFTGQDMSIAASRAVYNKQQELLGVVSVDLFLSHLSSFLQRLEIGESGYAFIMERSSGLLVASSADERPFSEPDKKGNRRRLLAQESKIPLIRYSSQALFSNSKDYDPQSAINKNQYFIVRGKHHFLQVSPIVLKDGPEWLIAVVIPASDFMGHIGINNRMTLYLIVLTLLVAIFVSIFTTRKIIGPIQQLSDYAIELSKGNWDHHIIQHDSRIFEISTLTRSFNHMVIQLQHMVSELTSEVAIRKQTEETLRESKERFRTTLDSIGDAVISTNINGEITGMNPVAEKLTEWKFEEVRGKPFSEIFNVINAINREPISNIVDKVLLTGEIVELNNDILLLTKRGNERQIADSAAPIRDSSLSITGVVLVFRDITEQLQAEQELIKAKKLESLGILAGGIAHDFNNLLTGLFGNIEMAQMFLSPDHKSQKYLKIAEGSMKNATNLTQQLLTFAKGGDPIKKAISIASVLLETAQFSVRGSNTIVQTFIAPDLWYVEADKGQLSQVISNLVINARQSMPDGGTITITAENITVEEAPVVQVVVQDEGIGIDPGFVDKIFDPYFTTREKGNGLGLASTRSIVIKHNGTIKVDSKLNEGTRFTIHLPAIIQKQETENISSVNSQTSAGYSASILVLDDEEMIRDIARRMLQKMGHRVTLAENGNEAITLYQRAYEKGTPFDLVITDLTIPGGVGGQAVARKIRQLNPEARIIVSSGYSNDQVLARYIDYGFVGILVKPFGFSELRKIIEEVLKA